MTTPSPPNPPQWPHCGRDATPENPHGCRGIHVPGHTACLAHLDPADRTAYLATLGPGTDIDHRGTTFTPRLLQELLDPLRDPANGILHLGTARFDLAVFTGEAQFFGAAFTGDAGFAGATFTGDAWFGGAAFTGYAQFGGATFTDTAGFGGVTFTGAAGFGGATFTDTAVFSRATFTGDAVFHGAAFTGEAQFFGATFTDDAGFTEAAFTGTAGFSEATFTGDAWFGGVTFTDTAGFSGVTFAGATVFHGATFTGDALFNGARFEAAQHLGPMACGKKLDLGGSVFGVPVVVEAAAREVVCVRTQWSSASTLRLRCARLDLAGAVLEYPLTVAAAPDPFTTDFLRTPVPEVVLSGADPGVGLVDVSGVDAAHLVLQDIGLGQCRFAGAVHLAQLQVDGWCRFSFTPSRRRRWLPGVPRWGRRWCLAEEHHWRATAPGAAGRGWTPAPDGVAVRQPAALAALYRQLRKGFEDGKNEPGAADFYYGEMEMRRRDRTWPAAERALITAYWALSGYGLRAMRALGWLVAAMAVTMLVLMMWGLPADDPKPQTTGRQVTAGQDLTLTTDTPKPRNPTGPLHARLSTDRFEKSLRVVINSVVFRSSGQNLTTTGTYAEMASRITEPVLLALAVLAIRSRVKR
jgi:hypothetical protein